MSEDIAVGEPERLHPLFLLTGLGGSLRGMAGGYALVAYLAFSGRLGTALFAMLALVVFVTVGILLYWARFEYRVGANEIRIDSGILSRTHRSIPFDRVQDVDISQGPLARLLGLAKVKFETGASGGTDEGVLQAISLERAQQLRELVRSRRSGVGVAPSPGVAEEAGRPPVYALSVPRLLLAGVFNFSLAVFAGLFGLSQTVGDVIGFDPFSRSFWNSALSASVPVQQFILANQVITAIAGLASLVLVGIGTGIVRTTLRNYGFRLDRTETGLRRRRGLVSLTDVTMPVRRAQAAILASGPVRERFGWSELKLQSLARDEGSGGGDHVLAPLATAEEADRIVSALGWRPLPAPVAWARVSPVYVLVLAIALVPLMLLALTLLAAAPVAAGLAGADGNAELIEAARSTQITALALLAVMTIGLAVRLLAWRRTGYALDGDRLLIRTGWWRRRTLVLPVVRIQSIDLAQSFVARWFGTAALTFGIAGGGSMQVNSIPALPREIARDLRQQLLSRLA